MGGCGCGLCVGGVTLKLSKADRMGVSFCFCPPTPPVLSPLARVVSELELTLRTMSRVYLIDEDFMVGAVVGLEVSGGKGASLPWEFDRTWHDSSAVIILVTIRSGKGERVRWL